uniref:R13L1/DRL21-like LRR repeat region domain-containing protein n=1 Tax=Leersia perrieri TaxID=77586 RepID=A0A0D9XS18_9ORYZ
MDSKDTEISSREGRADQKDIRAGFALVSILRAIFDRATLVIETLQNRSVASDPALSGDYEQRTVLSDYEPLIEEHINMGWTFPFSSFMSHGAVIGAGIASASLFSSSLLWPGITSILSENSSLLSGDYMIQDLQRCLNKLMHVLSKMEAKVLYTAILGWQDDTLFAMALAIERNLDMLEYKQVQKHENDDILKDMKPLLKSILRVLKEALEELPVNMPSDRQTVDKADDITKLSSNQPNLEKLGNKSANPSVEMRIPIWVKESLEMQLLDKGQDGIYLIPFLLSSESEDFVIPIIKDVYNNSRVKEHFEVRIWVNIYGRSTTIKSEVSVPSCINELMNYHVMNSVNHLPPVHSEEFENWIEQNGTDGDSREAYHQKMKDLEEVIHCGLVGRKFVLVLDSISEDQMGQLEHLLRVTKCGRKGSKVILLTTSTNIEESVRNMNIMRGDQIDNNLHWRFFRSYAFDNFSIHSYKVNHLHHEVISAKTFRRVESNYLPANPQLSTHMSIMSGFLPTLKKFQEQITEWHLHTLINLPKLSNESRHHLRYLSLQDTGIQTLDLDNFYHLLVLNVQGCQLSNFPDHISQNLSRVRHIIGPASLVSSIHCIGNLKNLQELQEFRVHKLPGFGIEELEGMNLRGSLSITNLENVAIATKAGEVNLSLKSCLVSLKLGLNSTQGTSQSVSEKVLERLKPPDSLNELEINGYRGIISPTWFAEDCLINVKKIILRNCSSVSVLAPLSKLPNLEVLTLESFSMLERTSESGRIQYLEYVLRLLKFPTETSCSFPRLMKLRIEDMPVLEEWIEQEPCFPCLKELTLRNCPKLTVLPPLHHARIKRIHIEGVQLISFGSPFGVFLDRSLQPSNMFVLRHCPNLSTFTIPADNSSSSHCIGPLLQLEITDCRELKAIKGALGIVEKLHIEKCHSSLKLPKGNMMQSLHTLHIDSVSTRMDTFLLGLQALRVLIIKDSAELNSLDVLLESDHMPDTLEQLQLINCNSIKSLPWNMDRVLGLELLCLLNCPSMQFLPCLPNNLTELRIRGCPILKEKYGDNGPDWDDISHVPYVSVD